MNKESMERAREIIGAGIPIIGKSAKSKALNMKKTDSGLTAPKIRKGVK